MQPPQILLVEDESIVALDIAQKLESYGYKVLAITDSGADAVQICQNICPSLVLMDIMLQGDMDGIEATKQIHLKCDAPVVYMTAYADETTLERAKETNPFGYVVKPVQALGLRATVEMALQRHQFERHFLEDALRHQSQVLMELQNQYINITSHELRSPMTSLYMAIDALIDKQELTQERKVKYLHRMRNAVLYMTEFLDDMLTYGEAGTFSFHFNPIPSDLFALCDQLVEELQLSIAPQLRLTICDCLPAELIALDRKLIRHILFNLISNAVKYSPEGEFVNLQVKCHKDAVIFQVRDRGIGIPPEYLEKIFDAFSRGNNVGKIRGTGLGMTVVKQCVELHGGSISIDSVVQVGTTVTITIPAIAA